MNARRGAAPHRAARRPPAAPSRRARARCGAQRRRRRPDGDAEAARPEGRARRRRSALAGTAAAAAVLLSWPSGGLAADDARLLVSRAAQRFRENDVGGAVALFDEAVARNPGLSPFLWQRGLALYYDDSFAAAAAQFRDDVRVNPSDTEEAVWEFISRARRGEGDVGAARRDFLELRGGDRRRVMGSVLSLFRSGDEAAREALVALAERPASDSDAFYSSLYLGLYAEALGDGERARYWIGRASSSQYGQRAQGDFMTAVARVHMARRGWTGEPS